MMKPRPKAAPIRPKLFARCSGGVVSEIAACATAMLPPVKPSSAREKKSSGRLRRMTPRANSTYDRHVPISEKSRTGLRPNRSESSPRIGVATNCISGNIVTSRPSSR